MLQQEHTCKLSCCDGPCTDASPNNCVVRVPQLAAAILLGRFLAAHAAALLYALQELLSVMMAVRLDQIVLLSHSTNILACRTVGTSPHDSKRGRAPHLPSFAFMQALTVCNLHLCSCADSNADSALQLQGYTAAGQTSYALDSLQWIANYFVQNHHADLAFTGQIGNVGDDHSSWGRPENMTEDRPGFDLTPTAPGDFCITWASWYNTWLLIQVLQKVVVPPPPPFSFSFFFLFLFSSFPFLFVTTGCQ